ncbi:DAK2 domain-containing protein [Streptomyces sp. 4N509B]|uniref:DAK2 domain-containing protein n=1 Tax=Streptomyces sp. 4N509B TaxID=3457413 RepID=UPI003FD69DB5
MPQPLDATAVRRWCAIALHSLGQAREGIDAINVYPVADGDTGTNLYLTVESAAQAVAAAEAANPTLTDAVRTMAHGALIGAHGNSGTILAQLLRGMAEALAAGPEPADAEALSAALARAARSAYEAVAHPVEGTMLTVARAAADAAGAAGADGADGAASAGPAAGTARVAAAACAGARRALAATPGQLAVLAEADVVDAGGSGLVTVLEALDAALSGRAPDTALHHGLGHQTAAGRGGGAAVVRRQERETRRHQAGAGQHEEDRGCEGTDGGPEGHGDHLGHGGYEVIYLLDAPDAAVGPLRERLDALGDSLVVVGGDGLWHVHLHTGEPGPAVEAGLEAGRPHRIRISWLAAGHPSPERPGPARRAVLAVTPGDGLAQLCREVGAEAVVTRPEEPPGSGELAAVIHRAHAREVVVLPNDEALWHAAAAAAEQARAAGTRVAVIPTRSPVQGLAALAVHAPERRFDEDVVAMTAAAGATRFGEVAVADREAWTMAGVCQAGDVLGLVEGDVAVIGDDVAEVAGQVLERMLSAGGELVTLVLGAQAPTGLADRLREQVRRGHLGVDTEVCDGRQGVPLLIGVE